MTCAEEAWGDTFRAGRALDAHWAELRMALRSDPLHKTLEQFQEREDIHRKAAEKELNRRLYGG